MRRIVTWALTLTICLAAVGEAKATKEQKEKAKAAFEAYPARIALPAQVAELAWERASEWITMMPDRRIEVSTKNAIQTYRAYDSASMDLTCGAKRRRSGDEVLITADCQVNNSFAKGEERRGSAVLRRYVLTGDEACLVNGERWDETAECLLECSADGETCRALPADPVFPEVVTEEPMLVGSCTLDQIVTMVQSGLTKDQVTAACGG